MSVKALIEAGKMLQLHGGDYFAGSQWRVKFNAAARNALPEIEELIRLNRDLLATNDATARAVILDFIKEIVGGGE